MKNDVLILQRLLKLRTLFKRVTQVSWNIGTIEKRFDITSPLSQNKIEDILLAYKEQAKVLDEINSGLKEALNED